MNQNISQTSEYFTEFLKNENKENDYIFFPPSYLLSYFSENLKGKIDWGSQNCYFEDSGAFTGEVSPKILKEMGADYSLVGHSERRHIFGETDEWVNLKTLKLIELDMTPIICVGETLEQRKSNETDSVIENQIKKALKGVDETQNFSIAYEPVWAIGTGEVASPEQVAQMHGYIRGLLNAMYSHEKTASTPILYGGSVKPANSASLFEIENVNGFLVGGASLDAKTFLQI